ncbi:MAG: hypothetical protein ABSD77_01625 [Verrucomicrobiota bacterium]|jgi:hypothetical protein
MNLKAFILAVCLPGFVVSTGLGFQSSNSSLQRTFASSLTLTNWPIVVTATFTNADGTVLNGFFYSDQVPSALSVRTLSLTLNGMAVTNYTFESGQDGDVYPGCTPCRWILEEPPNFSETNPVPSQASVQIVYAVNSSSPGSFALQQFGWAAYEPGLTNAIFGYSEPADQQLLQFVTPSYQLSLAGQYATNSFTLQLVGVPGYYYALERSTNLTDWVALTTNVSPFVFTDTNAAGLPQCFYRSRWLP